MGAGVSGSVISVGAFVLLGALVGSMGGRVGTGAAVGAPGSTGAGAGVSSYAQLAASKSKQVTFVNWFNGKPESSAAAP